MRPPRAAVWFAVVGALLGVLFFALGHISPDPSDHPRWLMAGSRPVTLAYVVFMGFCLPALLIDFGLLSMIPGWRPGDILSFVTYPLVQGLLYGGFVWVTFVRGKSHSQSVTKSAHTARHIGSNAKQKASLHASCRGSGVSYFVQHSLAVLDPLAVAAIVDRRLRQGLLHRIQQRHQGGQALSSWEIF